MLKYHCLLSRNFKNYRSNCNEFLEHIFLLGLRCSLMKSFEKIDNKFSERADQNVLFASSDLSGF